MIVATQAEIDAAANVLSDALDDTPFDTCRYLVGLMLAAMGNVRQMEIAEKVMKRDAPMLRALSVHDND